MAVRTALAWYGYGLSGESETPVFPLISFIEGNSESFQSYANNKRLQNLF